jgi:hypothetical protein
MDTDSGWTAQRMRAMVYWSLAAHALDVEAAKGRSCA